MSEARRMARNAAAMLVSQAITWSASFALMVFLPRVLGAADYGKLQLVLSLVGMLSVGIDFGLGTLVTREVARDPSQAPSLLTNALIIKAVTGTVSFLLLLAAVAGMHRPPEVMALALILGAGMLLFATTAFCDSILQGFERANTVAWGKVIEKVLEAAGILTLLALGYRLLPVASVMLAVGAIHLGWSGYWVLRRVRPSRALLSRACVRQLAGAALPFFLYAAIGQLYDQIDVVMLAAMDTDTVVGWYTAAYRLFETLFFLPHIFSTVTFPVLARLAMGDADLFRLAVRRAFAFLCVAAGGVCTAGVFLAGPLVELLYRRSFPGTAPALRLLMPALACMYVNAVLVMVLQTKDLQARWLKAGAMAAVLNPCLNLLLIPRWHHLGTAIATSLTEGLLLLLAVRACPAGLLGRQEGGIAARTLAAAAVLAALLAACTAAGHPAIGAALGLAAYGLVLDRLGVLDAAQLHDTWRALTRRAKGEGEEGKQEGAKIRRT